VNSIDTIIDGDYSGADFTAADLSRAVIKNSSLAFATLRGALLNQTIIIDSTCFGADFYNATLKDSYFRGLNLDQAKNIIAIGPLGPQQELAYAVRSDYGVMLKYGRFWGALAQWEKWVKEEYQSKYHHLCFAAISFIAAWDVTTTDTA
jgi:hypothetical protein